MMMAMRLDKDRATAMGLQYTETDRGMSRDIDTYEQNNDSKGMHVSVGVACSEDSNRRWVGLAR